LLVHLKFIWILALLINLFAILWFIIGSTANFQREIDVVTTVIFVYCGIPSIIIIILSVILLIKGWPPASMWGIAGVTILTVCMLLLSLPLFKNVNTSGWLTEKITSDTLQITTDGQYEYQLELVNLFQNNSYARLYIKNVSTDGEKRIPLDLPVEEIRGLSVSKDNHWITLINTDVENMYILRTTEDFPLSGISYEINVGIGETVRVEK